MEITRTSLTLDEAIVIYGNSQDKFVDEMIEKKVCSIDCNEGYKYFRFALLAFWFIPKSA